MQADGRGIGTILDSRISENYNEYKEFVEEVMRKYVNTNARDYDLGVNAFEDAVKRLHSGLNLFNNTAATADINGLDGGSNSQRGSGSQPGRKDNTSGKGNNANSGLTSKYNYLLSGLTDEQIEAADKIVSRIRMERYYAYGGYADLTFYYYSNILLSNMNIYSAAPGMISDCSAGIISCLFLLSLPFSSFRCARNSLDSVGLFYFFFTVPPPPRLLTIGVEHCIIGLIQSVEFNRLFFYYRLSV